MSEHDDWMDEAGDALAGLLARARRAAEVGIAGEDSARIWAVVRHGRRTRAKHLWLVASVAAALAMIAGLAGMRRPAIEIVKEVAFESIHDGQVVRFEMTVYKESRKEKADVEKPSL
jgi:hypothetical protein